MSRRAAEIEVIELAPTSRLSSADVVRRQSFFDTLQAIAALHPLATLPPTAVTSALMSEQNPFWMEGRALAVWIINQVCLIAFFHPAQLLDNQPSLHFGYFALRENSADDARAVFEKVDEWARSVGARSIVGPIQFKTAYDYRLRTSAFEEKTFWGEPQNPPHYVTALRRLDFRVAQEYCTDFILNLERVRAIAKAKLGRAALSHAAARFEVFTPELFREHRSAIFQLANSLFAKNIAFQPLSQFDFQILYTDSVLSALCQRTSFLIFDQARVLRGLCFSFPHPHNSRCLLIKTIGIEESFRRGGQTFAQALKFIFDQSSEYEQLAFCLMIEDNQAHRLTKKYADQQRRYALFARSLATSVG